MEIITNLNYNADEHNLHPFLHEHFKPVLFPIVSHKAVGTIMNGRNMIQAMEKLLQLTWRTVRTSRPTESGQRTNVVLGDNTNVSVHLLQSGNKDKMVMMVTGDNESIHHLVIAYVGEKEMFHSYLKEMNISHLECYSNLIHLEEDEEEPTPQLN